MADRIIRTDWSDWWFKDKGDWCKEHERPESQCFACNPKLADKFAAEYEAKYGKRPPKPEQ